MEWVRGGEEVVPAEDKSKGQAGSLVAQKRWALG